MTVRARVGCPAVLLALSCFLATAAFAQPPTQQARWDTVTKRQAPSRAVAQQAQQDEPAEPQEPPPPPTDIYLVQIRIQDGDVMVLSFPINLTDRPKYDNQPVFLPNMRWILYSSEQDDDQTDIYAYDIDTGRSVRMTTTPESEYSPTPTPGGMHFSVVRVEEDGTQRLWKFPFDVGGPSVVLEDVEPVGYHAWADDHTVALFVLGDPPTLRLADTERGQVATVARNIGRSLHRIPGENPAISFVHKASDDEWWISRFDLERRGITPMVWTLEGSEDYCWTPDGTILMAQGAKLYKWKPDEDQGWLEVADFSGAGIDSITRIAVSPTGDYMAFVATRAEVQAVQ